VAAGQRNTARAAAAATDSPTPHLPALPMLCLQSAKQRQRHLILRKPPPSGVAIGLLIAISLSFDRT